MARGGNDIEQFVAADPEAGAVVPLEGQEAFTLSTLDLYRPGAELHVLGVEALTSPNVQYVGAVNVWPRDSAKNALFTGPGFPAPEIKTHHPLDEIVPASETDIPALPGIERPPPLSVAVGFRLLSGDLGAVNGVRVTYTADGKKAVETFRVALIVCTKSRFCEPSKGESDSEFNDRVLNQFGLLPKKS